MGLDDYPKVVPNPMDLRTVTNRLANRSYRDPAALKEDILLVFANCRRYNAEPDNVYHKMAVEVEQFFHKRWAKMEIDDKMLRYRKDGGELSPEDLAWKECERILEMLKKAKESWPFRQPVDPVALQCPNYFKIIEKPMDLSTIQAQLKGGKYEKVTDFRDDVRLMVENCLRFNRPGENVYKLGQAILEIFERRWESSEIEEKLGLKAPRRREADLGGMDVSTEEGRVWLAALEVFRWLFNHERSGPFRAQVDRAAVPEYYAVVKKPMDLGLIGFKMKHKKYGNPHEIHRDLDLLFRNCRLFYRADGPGAAVRAAGEELEAGWRQRWREAGIDEAAGGEAAAWDGGGVAGAGGGGGGGGEGKADSERTEEVGGGGGGLEVEVEGGAAAPGGEVAEVAKRTAEEGGAGAAVGETKEAEAVVEAPMEVEAKVEEAPPPEPAKAPAGLKLKISLKAPKKPEAGEAGDGGGGGEEKKKRKRKR